MDFKPKWFPLDEDIGLLVTTMKEYVCLNICKLMESWKTVTIITMSPDEYKKVIDQYADNRFREDNPTMSFFNKFMFVAQESPVSYRKRSDVSENYVFFNLETYDNLFKNRFYIQAAIEDAEKFIKEVQTRGVKQEVKNLIEILAFHLFSKDVSWPCSLCMEQKNQEKITALLDCDEHWDSLSKNFALAALDEIKPHLVNMVYAANDLPLPEVDVLEIIRQNQEELSHNLRYGPVYPKERNMYDVFEQHIYRFLSDK